MVQEGVKLKYGPFKGNTELYIPGYMGNAEVISDQSGRFVVQDGGGYLDIAADGDAEIAGWVEGAAQTTSTTRGNTVLAFIPAAACLGMVFRIPINVGTFVITMRGDTSDLSIASNIQGAKLDASGEDVIIILDGDLVNNNWVDVTLNPLKLSATGVV